MVIADAGLGVVLELGGVDFGACWGGLLGWLGGGGATCRLVGHWGWLGGYELGWEWVLGLCWINLGAY